MIADRLLSKLDMVKRTGVDRWLACCPAHDDKRPSLAIRECEDGRLLIHCFAGCGVESIVSAIGLELADLFPEREIDHARRERRPFNAHDVLEALANEALIVSICSSDLQQGKALSQTDHARLILAASRIESGRELSNG